MGLIHSQLKGKVLCQLSTDQSNAFLHESVFVDYCLPSFTYLCQGLYLICAEG